ncbi:MAG: pentapeptide repeat-containing protein [Hyphomicrobiales bacterium]|nr:pentapeptide repeat-containing protein [Hyphomicrobiales bacterium]
MGQETLSPANAQPVVDRPDLAPIPAASAPAGAAEPGPAPSALAALPDELPEFAKQADDLETIKKAVDDAASVSGALWLSYLFVLFYLAVAAGAVTHADLFFEKPVKLPFLGIDLPLMAFFSLAPLLFLVVHAYTLVHLVMLTDKAKRYDQALAQQISNEKALPKDVRERNAAIRAALRRQLPSNIFVQFLAGPADLRDSLFGYLLRAIAWVTLVVAPVLLLLMMQIQFLPFHSSFIAWTQRGALLADLILIWWLWRKILSGREPGPYLGPRLLWAAAGLAFTLGAFLFSWTVATFPDEWQEEALATWQFSPASHAPRAADDKPGAPQGMTEVFRDRTAPLWNWALTTAASLHDGIFNSKVDRITRRRRLPFSSTLVLPGLNVYEELGVDDPEKISMRDFVFRARGRDLKGAILDIASLPKVDFEGAHLEGASLAGARLQGARLWDAHLQGASLGSAQLQGAWLGGAQLQGAWLVRAQLQGASLSSASLQGASLDLAHLQGASLNRVALSGAGLQYAQFQGASLEHAYLGVADLSAAYLWRTDRTAPPSISSVRMPGGDTSWQPLWRDESDHEQPWDDKAYQALRTTIESLVPAGRSRDAALMRIASLDCASSDEALASCDPKAWLAPLRKPPPEAEAWRKALDAARVNDADYELALADVLKRLVCSGGDEAIHVLRGTGFQFRLGAAGAAASDLIDNLTTKDANDCPVAAALTDADRAKLLGVKKDVEAFKNPGG